MSGSSSTTRMRSLEALVSVTLEVVGFSAVASTRILSRMRDGGFYSLGPSAVDSFAPPHEPSPERMKQLRVFWIVASLTACATTSRLSPPADDVDLVIASTTDVHGRVRAWDYYANQAETVRG